MKLSKNAQKGKADELKCRCGGTVHCVSLFRNGKLKTMARCTDCKREARKPRDLS